MKCIKELDKSGHTLMNRPAYGSSEYKHWQSAISHARYIQKNNPQWLKDHGIEVPPRSTPEQQRQKQAKKDAWSAFYSTREWRQVRYQALKQNNGRCELCGASKHDGARLHVDHIIPRSKRPELELTLSNLQVLCEECNIGKSNLDATDWRKPPEHESENLIEWYIRANKFNDNMH